MKPDPRMEGAEPMSNETSRPNIFQIVSVANLFVALFFMISAVAHFFPPTWCKITIAGIIWLSVFCFGIFGGPQ